MKRFKGFIVLTLACFFSSTPVWAAVYKVDKDHTSVCLGTINGSTGTILDHINRSDVFLLEQIKITSGNTINNI